MKKDDDKNENHEADDVTVDTDTDLAKSSVDDRPTHLEEDAYRDDSVVAEESMQETIKKLREKLKRAEKEKQEYLTNWQKDKADFLNLRKQDSSDRETFMKWATAGLLSDIIPALDSFEIARKDEAAWQALPPEWRKGMESSIGQLVAALESHGLEKIKALGEAFDPKLHEAVNMVPVTKKEEDHMVKGVFQAGYMLNGKLVRPAKVQIGEYEGKNNE